MNETINNPTTVTAVIGRTKVMVFKIIDKVVKLWKSGTMGKIVCIAVVVVFARLISPQGGSEDAISSNNASMAQLGLKKMHDTDEMWIEGTNVVKFTAFLGDGKYSEESYVEVEPNFITGMDTIQSVSSVIGSGAEEGTIYHDMGSLKVEHVDADAVIASATPYGLNKHFAYIETPDEYIDGQGLAPALYVCTGRAKIEMTDGSSKTVYAFKKQSNALCDEYVNAHQYNYDAQKAAQNENQRRRDNAESEARKRYEAECLALKTKIDEIFLPLARKFLNGGILQDRIRIAPGLEGKLSLSTSLDSWGDFGKTPPTVERLEAEGILCCYELNSLPGKFSGLAEKETESYLNEHVFDNARYELKLSDIAAGCDIQCRFVKTDGAISDPFSPYGISENARKIFAAKTIKAINVFDRNEIKRKVDALFVPGALKLCEKEFLQDRIHLADGIECKIYETKRFPSPEKLNEEGCLGILSKEELDGLFDCSQEQLKEKVDEFLRRLETNPPSVKISLHPKSYEVCVVDTECEALKSSDWLNPNEVGGIYVFDGAKDRDLTYAWSNYWNTKRKFVEDFNAKYGKNEQK